MKITTLHNLPAATAKRLADVSDERHLGDPIMVYTIKGWAFEPALNEAVALHVRGFQTRAELIAGVRQVQTCRCARCRRDD